MRDLQEQMVLKQQLKEQERLQRQNEDIKVHLDCHMLGIDCILLPVILCRSSKKLNRTRHLEKVVQARLKGQSRPEDEE